MKIARKNTESRRPFLKRLHQFRTKVLKTELTKIRFKKLNQKGRVLISLRSCVVAVLKALKGGKTEYSTCAAINGQVAGKRACPSGARWWPGVRTPVPRARYPGIALRGKGFPLPLRARTSRSRCESDHALPGGALALARNAATRRSR